MKFWLFFLPGRAAAEHEARAAQELWLAAQSLLNATIKNAFSKMDILSRGILHVVGANTKAGLAASHIECKLQN